MSFIKVHLYGAGILLMIVLSCFKAAESQIIEKLLLLDLNCTKEITGNCCPIGSFPSPNFRAENSRMRCSLCPVGTYCSSGKCSSCTDCDAGFEARYIGSTNCTECAKGFFKAHRSSGLCIPCPAGYFADRTGQVNCTQCPAKYYCKAGAIEPILCESYYVCPLGTGTPVECDPPWHVKTDKGCSLSVALIIVICVITVPIVVAVIAFIIYKIYKYCRRRRYAELYGSETEPLLAGSRLRSHLLQEPVYTGL